MLIEPAKELIGLPRKNRSSLLNSRVQRGLRRDIGRLDIHPVDPATATLLRVVMSGNEQPAHEQSGVFPVECESAGFIHTWQGIKKPHILIGRLVKIRSDCSRPAAAITAPWAGQNL